jgi:hypothetical protein
MALLYAGWKKWQVIVYKIAISIMALSYFCMGIYCFYTNFSFTYHLYIPFDKRGKYFITLFILGLFELSCEMVRVFSHFDYTEKFKYVYRIKNVNEVRIEQRKEIKQTRKESIRCSLLIKL